MSEQIDDLDAQLAAAKAISYKLNDEEIERREKARLIEAQYERINKELSERLEAEADIATASARAQYGEKLPIGNMWSAEAHKLCGIGWLVLGPGDHGYAIEALKNAGSYNPDRKGVQVIESDIDVMLPVVQKAILRAPIKLENYSDALTKAPHFVVACFRKVEELGGSGAREAKGKSKR